MPLRMAKKKSKLWILWLAVAGALFSGMVVFGILAVALAGADFRTGNVALIKIRGTITTDGGVDTLGESGTGAADIIGFIEEAEEDSFIKAIVLDINSPGGSAVGSDEIAQAVKRAEKPTVAFVHEIGTSGAYWVASASDHIIANRMSIVGSIGVIASYLEFSKLFEEYGITYQRFVAGKYKDLGSPFKGAGDDERALLQAKLDRLHAFFIDEVAANRGLAREQVQAIATGEIFLGGEGAGLGLVDEVGGQEALEAYLQTLGIDDVSFKVYEREQTLLDVLGSVASRQFFFIGRGIGNALVEAAYQAPALVA